MDQAPDVRASDEDREGTARELREHFAAGRLDQDDLDGRLAAAYAATTLPQLRGLTADLPALPVSAAKAQAELAQRRSELRRRLLQETGAGFVPFVICTVIWVVAGASGAFWPAFLLIAALLPLMRGGWQLYGPVPDLDQFEAELEARRERRSGAAGRAVARDERHQTPRAARRAQRAGRRRF